MGRPLVAIDWGTSALRGARLDDDGAVLEERAFPRGILTVEAGKFAAVFDELFGDWMSAPDALCLIAGMAGSKQGWIEAPYCACPAGAQEVAAKLAWVAPDRIAIVPGLSCAHDDIPDVMRGEETQVFGALNLLGVDSGTLVLPGTHSKWVRVEAGRVNDFTTAMTGEFYALLRQHSILARTLPADDGPFHGDAFDAGVAHAMRSPGLLQSAFSARTLALFGRLPQAQQPSYLSGLVIGEELRERALHADAHVVVVGAAVLTVRYARALASLGVRADTVGAQAGWRGLHDIARTIRA
ncbi:MAG: 2-dehydro-3-deoxygalactonokinase [Ramlibacter sp.]|nr:2-dehydro-3-deoxygalactonokinase [Ramlibacter sp.]